MQSQPEKESQDICRQCGFCCDGTLFEIVDLQLGELVEPLQKVGIKIFTDGENKFFCQPCKAYESPLCGIYSQRPQQCEKYQCRLLRQIFGEEISRSEALETIRTTKLQRDELKSQIESVIGLQLNLTVWEQAKKFEELQRSIQGPAAFKKFSSIFLNLAVLQARLDQYFRDRKSRRH